MRSMQSEAPLGRTRSEGTPGYPSPYPAEVPHLLPNPFTGTGGLDPLAQQSRTAIPGNVGGLKGYSDRVGRLEV